MTAPRLVRRPVATPSHATPSPVAPSPAAVPSPAGRPGPRPLLSLAAGALLWASAAAAQQVALGPLAADPDLPVEVESATLAVDQATGAAVFSGGVTVGQGDLRLQAATVEVRYDEANARIARLLASGGVTLATPEEAAEAESADYDLVAGTLTLEGEVLLTQGPNALSADRMVVDLAAGTARLEGRVRTILGAGLGEGGLAPAAPAEAAP